MNDTPSAEFREAVRLAWNAAVGHGRPSGAVTVMTYERGDLRPLLVAEAIEATHVLPAGSPAVAVVVGGVG